MWKFRNEDGTPRFSPLAIAGMVVGGAALAVGFAFLFGWAVMLLWNWLMPEIFGLPTIGYWQGWGLVLLSAILFKGGSSGSGGGKGRRGGHRGGRGVWKDDAERRFSRECADGGRGEEPGKPGDEP